MSTYTEGRPVTDQMQWRIDDVIGNRHFDLSRRWLPLRLSGADRVACLSPSEKVSSPTSSWAPTRTCSRAWRSSSPPP